jgi:hypothetical protein
MRPRMCSRNAGLRVGIRVSRGRLLLHIIDYRINNEPAQLQFRVTVLNLVQRWTMFEPWVTLELLVRT